jgi:hypothetical protein
MLHNACSFRINRINADTPGRQIKSDAAIIPEKTTLCNPYFKNNYTFVTFVSHKKLPLPEISPKNRPPAPQNLKMITEVTNPDLTR